MAFLVATAAMRHSSQPSKQASQRQSLPARLFHVPTRRLPYLPPPLRSYPPLPRRSAWRLRGVARCMSPHTLLASASRPSTHRPGSSTVNSPHLLEFIGFGTTAAGNGFIVIKLMSGGSLEDALHNPERKLPWRKRVQIGLQVAHGMEHLHQRQMLHRVRDLKSANVATRP